MNKPPLQTKGLSKKKYTRPKLNKVGKITSITLKTGSQTDFGTGKFTA